MSDPLFQVDETGEDLTRADEAATTSATLSPAEKAATREEHERLAEGALVRADELVAGYVPGVNILRGCDFYLQGRRAGRHHRPERRRQVDPAQDLFGLIPVRSGSVSLRGENITSAPAHRLVSLGVGYVPQNNNVFPSLTIEENMQMGIFLRPKSFKDRFDFVVDLFPLLGERRKAKAGTLSGGERQMVAMGRALMMDPSVLLLDEPSAGLSPVFQDEVFIRCRRINATGVSIIMVEQNARRCLQICDRGYVLDQGRNAYTDTGQSLMTTPRSSSSTSGRWPRRSSPHQFHPSAPVPAKGAGADVVSHAPGVCAGAPLWRPERGLSAHICGRGRTGQHSGPAPSAVPGHCGGAYRRTPPAPYLSAATYGASYLSAGGRCPGR